ncbi:MAG: hypothetical protein HOK80_01450 [Candidatus Cloacimonetes bacterium]|mgnify:CR=1 FL=1|jgi:hypothetical protein|nr:hypothetical protein [Candidatus Cloacimonadota bacterium]MBT4332196.1 hypothetical protein [Candidatus Cloacimonadota bacterium]MBT4576070.1 hypothetical protein [Candidatus Cloacimonadota bacterium]MBT5419527.1 hypothetical protein [Candidatus Cloacimonadota bacterium]
MREVVLSIPTLEAEQNLEIDVRINGKKRTLKYRVEIVHWQGSEPSSEEKVTVIRHAIDDYDKNWELIQIGSPDEEKISLMFKKKSVAK